MPSINIGVYLSKAEYEVYQRKGVMELANETARDAFKGVILVRLKQ
jgi:hypothetical protein